MLFEIAFYVMGLDFQIKETREEEEGDRLIWVKGPCKGLFITTQPGLENISDGGI